jgi:hypothetical protein
MSNSCCVARAGIDFHSDKMFSTEIKRAAAAKVLQLQHMDTPMSTQSAPSVPSAGGRRRKLIITAVLFLLVLLFGGYYYATYMMDSNSLSEQDRQEIMERIIAESAEGGLSDSTRDAIVKSMEKEQQASSGITEEQRQAIINSMLSESAQ